jgi:hypothetical protein
MAGIEEASEVSVQEALDLIIRAKVDALEKLRSLRGDKLRLDELFQRHVRPLLGGVEEGQGWYLLCLALHLLEPPCECLIVDYYIRERDEALVPNHWNVRAGCVTQLRSTLARLLGG